MATLDLININKIYPNGVQAVFDFNLHIEDKEFIVFVGPSGCGKSTTLRMIAGLEDISSGELLIDGELMNDVAPKDRNIAMVFQSYALYPHMTVYDNMAFGLKLRKFPKEEIKEKVEAAAEILGLTAYLDRKPKALSGGQRQRVALGRAIVRNAKVFLMDEPLSNLDAKLRVTMRGELTKLHKKLGSTTIYVTHDQIEAMTMASRIVVMRDGRIQQVGTPEEIYDHPANVFVGGFIGTPPMNFIHGSISRDGKFTSAKGGHVVTVPADKLAVVTGMTCAGSKDGDGKIVATGICRKAQIWEPNENTHVAGAIKWYQTTCKARRAAQEGEAEKGFYYGADACSDLDEYITTNAVAGEILHTDYVDVYDGPYNGYNATASSLLTQVDTFTDSEKLVTGAARNQFMTLAPNSITKIRVYIWIEGQDIDNYDFASLGHSIKVNFGFTKERLTTGEIDTDIDPDSGNQGEIDDEQLPV